MGEESSFPPRELSIENMKILVANDLHFGVRNDSPIFHEHFRKYYSEVFFPLIDEHNIKTVALLGDIFDKRKQINFASLKVAREIFYDELKKRNIEVHQLLGNHDIAHKNVNEVNAPSLLLKDYDNVIIYDEPTDVDFDGTTITFMPWICPENYTRCMSHISNTFSKILFGHLELAGYKMYRNSTSHGGMETKIFDKFDVVASGHFHHKNEMYLGAAYEMNWNDYDDPRGVHIFDTETKKFKYFQNPFKIHHRIDYEERDYTLEEFSHLENCFVKIVVDSKKDVLKFDNFIKIIESCKLADYQILDGTISINLSEEVEEVDFEDTLTTLQKAANQLEENSEDVEKYLTSLYRKALENDG